MSQATYDSLVEVAGNVSRETFEGLLRFQAHFETWNSRINLVASSTLGELWIRHIIDSAQLRRIAPDVHHWVDLGSGGGFPGLVVSFLMRDVDGGHVDLVESNRKKAAFLQSTVGMFDLPAKVHAVRIEEAPSQVSETQAVTARALAPLPELLRLASPWLTNGARGIFHKGRDYRTEVEESADTWRFDLIEHRSATDAESVILEISNLARSR